MINHKVKSVLDTARANLKEKDPKTEKGKQDVAWLWGYVKGYVGGLDLGEEVETKKEIAKFEQECRAFLGE